MVAYGIVLLAAASIGCFGYQSVSPEEKAGVEGVVIDSQTKEPLRKAQVFISLTQDGGKNRTEQSYATATDDSGKFFFEGLDAGKYRLASEKIGYLGYPGRSYSRRSDVGKSELNIQLSNGQKI